MSERFSEAPRMLQGAELVRREGRTEWFIIEPGTYQADFGFRQFGQHENDWRSQMSDNPEDHELPFLFDHNSSSVTDFVDHLFEGENDFSDPNDVIAMLARYENTIASTPIQNREYHQSLSDIIEAGSGMCDAQTTLLGSLAARNTNLNAEAIHGQRGSVGEQLMYPFSHQWMRLTSGSMIYLYDPMYRKIAVYENDQNIYFIDGDNEYFKNMTPSCFAGAHLYSTIPMSWFSGARPVERYDGTGAYMYAEEEYAFQAQLLGRVPFAFEVEREFELKLHRDSLQVKQGETALYFPLQQLIREGD